MAIDRAAILRNAEKLLRQGKLDQAIAEYLRIVQEMPRDWNSANMLGDLYLRGGQVDKAVDQFIRIAEGLTEEGFFPKAGALYKKVLKVKPDEERALLQGAEIATILGLLVDARSYLNAVSERRRARGDEQGMLQIKIRLASLDPADYDARLGGARARLETNDREGALSDFKVLAAELVDKDRQPEALEALREAAAISPDDEEIRERLLDLYLAVGDYERARQCASTVEQLKSVAARLDAAGQIDAALASLRQAADLDPEDTALRTHLARAFLARGDMASAAEYLTVESAGDDSRLLLTVAEIQLRDGRTEEGFALVRQLLELDVTRRQDIALLGLTLAEHAPEIGYQLVEVAADAAIGESDWASAAAGLQEFVTRVPNHIPALMRLVEICVDGGLEATMYSAQTQLADAYIGAGLAAEARFLAEDLVAREPWERSNIERFRRALVLMGEPDPDALIAERLSGQSPFISTDLSLGSGDLPEFAEIADRPEPAAASSSEPLSPAPVSPEPAARRQPESDSLFELSSNAIDLERIIGEFNAPPSSGHQSDDDEIQISLDDFGPPAAVEPQGAGELDGLFAQPHGSAMDVAEQAYKQGLTLYHLGQIDDSIPALEAASRAPRLRFETASLLARIFRDRQIVEKEIEWLERAAQAPAPTPDEGYLLLYELAVALESSGEVARALAVCLELQADAGDYRDVAVRVDRLAKVQAGG